MRRSLLVFVLVLAATTPSLFGQTLLEEARQKAGEFWGRKFQRCGEFHAAHWPSGNLMLVRGFTWNLRAQAVDSQDAAAGVEWKGETTFTTTSHRNYVAASGWSEWQSQPISGAVAMIKKRGRWILTPINSTTITEQRGLNCDEVPPEKSASETAREEDQQFTKVCDSLVAALRQVSAPNLEQWVANGLDLGRCRSREGENLLILAAKHGSASAIAPLVTLVGLDVNERHNGLSPLDYAKAGWQKYDTSYRWEFQKTINALLFQGAVDDEAKPYIGTWESEHYQWGFAPEGAFTQVNKWREPYRNAKGTYVALQGRIILFGASERSHAAITVERLGSSQLKLTFGGTREAPEVYSKQ